MFLEDKNNKISDNNDILMTERNVKECSTLEDESRFVHFGGSILGSCRVCDEEVDELLNSHITCKECIQFFHKSCISTNTHRDDIFVSCIEHQVCRLEMSFNLFF